MMELIPIAIILALVFGIVAWAMYDGFGIGEMK